MSDCNYKDEITCPYCGYEQGDSWEASDSSDEEQCQDCEKKFCYQRETECHYNSWCIEGEHKYVHTPHPTIPDCYSCENCDSSEFKEQLTEHLESHRERRLQMKKEGKDLTYIDQAIKSEEVRLNQLT